MFPGLPRTEDIGERDWHVAEVPTPAVSRCGNTPCAEAELFDHLVGTCEQRRWNLEAERLGGLEIDDQLGFRGLLDR
jgi:hypothetical protein